MNRADIRRQVRGHLDALKNAGLAWLPRGEAVSLPTVPAIQEKEDSVAGKRQPEDLNQHRRTELKVLSDEVKLCVRCPELASTRTQTVFGVGALDPEVCFVGEAPGADEDAKGEPFVGAAGQLLNKIIAAMGFEREQVYICNTLRCRPPNNRTPLPHEQDNCRPFLTKQLELVRPKFLVALGGSAAASLLGAKESIGKLRGRFHDFQGIPVVVTYHPAYLLPHRNPEAKKQVWDDMKMLLAKMGREIPKSK